LAAAFLVLSLPSCAAVAGPFSSLGKVNLVSVEQETELSAEFAREVESKQRLVGNREVEDYVNDVGMRLVTALREPEFRYRFKVVDDREVNAFNIGGGRIYVHRGLLEAADTEGQVASVLAHETGHQVRRHVAKAISREQLFQTLASLAIGPNANQWIQLAAGLGITTGEMHFGREAEREADGVMVPLMTKAGWDPHEALGMFEKLRALEGREPGRVARIFSSHPPTSERIENVRREIGRTELPPRLVRDSRRFRDLKRELAGG
jgi:predicted Zn-dependent protease